MSAIQFHFIPLSVQEYCENVSRQQIERQTLPDFIYVKLDSFVDDVKYHRDLDNPLFTVETTLKKHKSECSYVCKKAFKSQKSFQEQFHN